MQMDSQAQVIAAFDFDGTLTDRDTTLSFFIFNAGFWKTWMRIIRTIPKLIGFIFGVVTRLEAKESLFSLFYKGMGQKELATVGQRFAENCIAKFLKAEAMERLQWHRTQGHRCILISASLDVYLKPWGEKVGFEGVIASQLAFDHEGKATGKLEGLNCRKGEKVRRLKELVGPLNQYVIYAYGDSDGDQELLEAATHPFYRKFR